MDLSFFVTTEGSEDKQKYNVNSYVKRAGPLLLGPQLCNSPVKCVTHCLARKDGTDQFYTVKVRAHRSSHLHLIEIIVPLSRSRNHSINP